MERQDQGDRTQGFTRQEFIEAKRLGAPHAGKPAARKTLYTYGSNLRVVEQLVGKPLAEFTEADFGEIPGKLRARGLAADTIGSMLSALNQTFFWAVKTGRYEGTNPLRRVTRAEERAAARAAAKVVVTEDEVWRLVAAFEALERERFARIAPDSMARSTGWFRAGPNPKWVLVTKLLYWGGLRVEEALDLKKDDLLADGVYIATAAGAGEGARVVPLPGWLMAELQEQIERHPRTEYVFYGDGSRARQGRGMAMSPNTYGHIWRQAVVRAGLGARRITPETLRESAADRPDEVSGGLGGARAGGAGSGPAVAESDDAERGSPGRPPVGAGTGRRRPPRAPPVGAVTA